MTASKTSALYMFLWRTVDIGSYGYFELFFGASYVYSGAQIGPGGETVLWVQYNRYGSLSELPNHHLELIVASVKRSF